MISTRTHTMAREAYQRVAKRRGKPHEKEYKSLAEALPGLILQNGLAQATGFLIAKDKHEHKAALDDLNAVLGAARVIDTADGEQLHRKVIRTDDPQLWMQLTRHSLTASGWIKRYAQGLLKSDTESADDQADVEEAS